MKISQEAADVFSFPLFSKEFCVRVVESSQALKWRRGDVYKGPRREYSKVRTCDEIRLKNFILLREAFAEKFESVVAPAAKFCWQWQIRRWRDGRLLRYHPGDYFGRHVDYYPGSGVRYSRILSLVCYLNDGFSGGETRFLRQNRVVLPEAGKAVIFPSGMTHPHCSEPVRAGTKQVFVAWLS
ncbi:MAG TPA: 2OG-Fe(II) oxygenase [Elusimicrobiota bacterium]|nr:2OG-Fe(II) oxygenase [Elusimicrobiota bacterium]